VVRLERNHWYGTTVTRLILRHAHRAVPKGIDVIGEPDFRNGLHREIERDLPGYVADRVATPAQGNSSTVDGVDRETPGPASATRASAARLTRDVRGKGIAGVLADLVASGDDVLAVTAHAPHRAKVLRERVGGFAVCSWGALADDPALAASFTHVVAVDPPTGPGLDHLSGQGWTHLVWGAPELQFAERIHTWDFALRDPLAALYRALRACRETGGEACEALLRGEGPQPRSAALAGRLVRVLAELDLVDFDREGPALRAVEAPERTALERSAAFRAYHRRLEDGLRFLSSSPIAAAA
jgi:single-stranded-DNA-specific exonuclease